MYAKFSVPIRLSRPSISRQACNTVCDNAIDNGNVYRTHKHPFNGSFTGTNRISWYRTGKVKPLYIVLKQQTTSGSGISWAICTSASSSRLKIMPAPHHSSFLQAGCPSCHPNNSVKALKAAMYTEVSNRIYQT